MEGLEKQILDLMQINKGLKAKIVMLKEEEDDWINLAVDLRNKMELVIKKKDATIKDLLAENSRLKDLLVESSRLKLDVEALTRLVGQKKQELVDMEESVVQRVAHSIKGLREERDDLWKQGMEISVRSLQQQMELAFEKNFRVDPQGHLDALQSHITTANQDIVRLSGCLTSKDTTILQQAARIRMLEGKLGEAGAGEMS
jgi:predicted  nucleic acid-binding Zn-ribbon protein